MRAIAAAVATSMRRIRHRPSRPLLSAAGVAAGVALAYAVGAANSTLNEGYQRLQQDLTGHAEMEIVTRGPRGSPQSLVRRVERVPGVAAAAPLVEHPVRLRGRSAVADVRLLGVDRRIRAIGGLGRAAPATADERSLGLHLPAAVARRLDLRTGSPVQVEARGSRRSTAVAAVLRDERIGALGRAGVAVAPLPLAQELAGSPGRVQRVLVRLREDAPASRETLARAAGPELIVRRAGDDARLLEQATELSSRSSSLFAALSLVVGGLLAYCAMVLSLSERRREVATLRALGCATAPLFAGAIAEALLIGGLGSVAGLVAGKLALTQVLEPSTQHLASAFILAPVTHVPLLVVGLSALAGIATSLAAAALPTRALVSVSPAAALRREPEAARVAAGAPSGWLIAGGALLMAAGVAAELSAGWLIGIPLWVAGGLLLVPVLLPAIVRALGRVLPSPGAAPRLAVAEVQVFPARGTATAAVIALTVAGVILFGGGVVNLEQGTARLADSTFGRGDLWVVAPGRDNVFLTRPFEPALADRAARLPFVRDATPLRAAFLDWGERKVYAFGFDFGAGRNFDSGEVVRGDPAALARDGRAVAVSDELARARGLRLGSVFELPTPSGPRHVRVVATLTNYGWAPGAVAMGAETFAHWWRQRDVGAVALRFEHGTPPAEASRRVAAALRTTGLEVATAARLRGRIEETASAGLGVLRTVAVLVAAGGLLAIAAAAIAGVLQRARRIAALRAIGMTPVQLASSLLAEAAILLLAGVAIGLPLGIGGQALAVHHLASSTSFPVTFQLAAGPLLAATAVTALIALVATLVPLRRAASTPLGRAFADA